MREEGKKNDGGKLRLDLVPVLAIQALGEVLTMGADKYGDNNWRGGLKWSRVYAAVQRHLNSWWGGSTYDEESGLNHLKHALCNIAFLIEYTETHPEFDDRYNPIRRNGTKECSSVNPLEH